MHVPAGPMIGVLAGSSVVLGLLVMRGFVLAQHARIMLGAVALVGLVGCAWTLASAAERAGGWKRLGIADVVISVLGTAAAALVPALVLAAR